MEGDRVILTEPILLTTAGGPALSSGRTGITSAIRVDRAGPGTVVLSHYLPADPTAESVTDWRERAAAEFTGTRVAGGDGF